MCVGLKPGTVLCVKNMINKEKFSQFPEASLAVLF